jgi:HAMP domain
VVALASWLTIVVARSVVQPLYRLRTGALELAGPRLAEAVRRASQNNSNPDSAQLGLKPIDVDASDEMGDIARAFDGMGRELLRLAVGEGAHHSKVNATFVDVSQRGQSLMERQIRLLQHLEKGEPDAKRLDTLFRVKRIGSRMHRYSENLLILVGHESASGWNQSVALANVIRAAVSEVEEYQRVSLNAQPDVALVGPAVNDVVHLLIELTENATSFSAADMQVDISGRALTSGGALLDISDRGVGMTRSTSSRYPTQACRPPNRSRPRPGRRCAPNCLRPSHRRSRSGRRRGGSALASRLSRTRRSPGHGRDPRPPRATTRVPPPLT